MHACACAYITHNNCSAALQLRTTVYARSCFCRSKSCPASMQALLLVICCFSSVVLGVIHNVQDQDELVQPLAVDVSPEDDLGSIAEDLLGPDFFAYRNKRQSDGGSGEPDRDIGTTTRLDGTNRHYFALVHWTGYPSEVLFIVTMTRRSNPTDSCLWRSTDYGKTFSNDTYKLNDTNVVIKWYYVSPLESNLVMVDSRQQKIFVTRDEGVSYVSHDLDFTPDTISFQGRGVPNVKEGTLPEHMLGYEQQSQALYVTVNLGETWVHLGNNISRYNWRILGPQYEDSTALYYERDVNDTHALLLITEDPYDESREFDPALGPIAINSTTLSNEFILVQTPVNWTDQETYSSPLWVSVYRRPFRKAVFPFELQQDHFAVMDASENQIFLAVEHSDGSDVHLYLSDADGVNYAFSLEDVVATEDWGANRPSFDIHAVQGMDGIYVVNQYVRPLPPSEPNATVPDPMTSTLISYNKGGHWQRLPAPAVDANNAATLCRLPQCSLHLRMATDRPLGYTSIQSKRSAVGLILAQGNVGESLVNENRLVRLYLSRDGGFSWQEIQQGHWTFQMIAQGSIIVLVPKRPTVDPVDYIMWSCDEGTTWTRYTFTPEPMRLIGLLPEKGERARRITLFGYFRGRSPFAWLIVELDFSDSVPNQCTYPDDYFEWIPTDGRSDMRCVLGVERTFERRNSSICCYIDPLFQRAVENVSCPCSREDYECDVGYEQLELDGPCVSTAGPVSPPVDCTEGGFYNVPSRYRKIVGDGCTEQPNSTFLVHTVPCPPVAPGRLRVTVLNSTESLAAGGPVTFSLTQETGWTMQTMYEWDFGDGISISGSGLSSFGVASHVYLQNGSYTVRVEASNAAGSSTIFTPIIIGDVSPRGLSISVEGDPSILGENLTFTLRQDRGLVTTTLYRWDFGDGNSVSGVGLEEYGVQTHSYDVEGSYTIRVEASNERGSSTIVTTIRIGDGSPRGLSVTVEGDTSTPGEDLVFTLQQERGLVTTTLYRWDFGDGNSVSGVGLEEYRVQTHSYDVEGSYTVTVEASNEDGSNTVYITVLVGDVAPRGLTISVEGDTTKAGENLIFTLSQEGGLVTTTLYQWDFGDGNNVSGVGLDQYGVQTHSYDEEGTYTVTVEASNKDGSSTVYTTILVGDVAPRGLTISVKGDTTKAGENLIFTLSQEGGLVTNNTLYRWDFGDGGNVSGVGLEEYGVQTHSYEKEGRYEVRVEASNDGGKSTASLVIGVGVNTDQISRNKKTEVGLEVGVTLTILIIVIVVALLIVVFVWYTKRYRNLQGRYRTLQEGAAPITLSGGEIQDDFGYSKEDEIDAYEGIGYSKEDEADDTALVDEL